MYLLSPRVLFVGPADAAGERGKHTTHAPGNVPGDLVH